MRWSRTCNLRRSWILIRQERAGAFHFRCARRSNPVRAANVVPGNWRAPAVLGHHLVLDRIIETRARKARARGASSTVAAPSSSGQAADDPRPPTSASGLQIMMRCSASFVARVMPFVDVAKSVRRLLARLRQTERVQPPERQASKRLAFRIHQDFRNDLCSESAPRFGASASGGTATSTE